MSFPTEKLIEKEQRQIFLRRIFRRVFLEDWGTKLIALGITFALWLGVTGLQTSITYTLHPVSLITQIPSDMEITNAPSQEIDVVVTGDKRKIDQLIALVNARDLVATIDLTDIKSGDHIVQLSPEILNLDIPNGVKIVRIEPNKISVKVEKVEEREVPVKIKTEGNVAAGFEIYSTTIAPSNVRVRGAESLVKSLDSVSTEKINIDNLKESFTARQTGLNIVNSKVTLLDTIVDVSFMIGEKRTERMFLVPVKLENEAKNATVVLYGGRSLMENLRAEDLHIEITKSEAGENTPQLILPPDLQNKVEIRKIKLPNQ